MNHASIASIAAVALPSMTLTAHGGSNQLSATIEIPRLDVAEYHRPYVAAWIESPEGALMAHLAVWYDLELPDREGETWLKDLRQWWRKGGRSLALPIDGLSGPTKPVGIHTLNVDLNTTDLASAPSGDYHFVVEASREVGGREMLRIPFKWGADQPSDASIQGERELGAVKLRIEP